MHRSNETLNKMQKSLPVRPKPKRRSNSKPADASKAGHSVAEGVPEKLPEQTPTELPIVERYLERQKRAAPSMTVTTVAGKNALAIDHQNKLVGNVLLMDALGTANISFFNGLVMQLANVGCQGREMKAADINFMLAMVEGVGPRDSDRGDVGGADGGGT